MADGAVMVLWSDLNQSPAIMVMLCYIESQNLSWKGPRRIIKSNCYVNGPCRDWAQDPGVINTVLWPSGLIGNGLQLFYGKPHHRGSAMVPGGPAALWEVGAEHGPHGFGQGRAQLPGPIPHPSQEQGSQGCRGSPSLHLPGDRDTPNPQAKLSPSVGGPGLVCP